MNRRSLEDIMSHTIVGFQSTVNEAAAAKLLIKQIGIEKASEMFEKSFQENPVGKYVNVWDDSCEDPVYIFVTNLVKPVEELSVVSISHLEFCSDNKLCPMVVFRVE